MDTVNDTLSSTEFRKRFASLTAQTTVTVNGHAIGFWFPVSSGIIAPFASQPDTPERRAEIAQRHPERDPFNEYRAVPKRPK